MIFDQYENRMQYNEYLRKHERKQNKGAIGTDSEKTKTYKSEWAFQKEFKEIVQFNNIHDAQKRADQITKSSTWKKLREEKGRTVRDVRVVEKQRSTGRGTAGWASGDKITLDQICGLDEYTLLHEMAHCLGNWHHGRSFRRDLLKLVSRFMGKDAATLLKQKFKEKKLACGEPRKPMEFDAWLESRERMMKMRGEKN